MSASSQVQDGAITASALNAVRGPAPSGLQTVAAGTVAPAAVGDVRIERSGSERWLHTSQTPEQVWPQVRAFWQERGLEIAKEQADIGSMETGWAENRAKLPQDIIRSTIGKLFDGLYSTGERDMYRTRVERNPSGGTDIYISHRGMQEVYTTQNRDQTAWQARPVDPQLEAEMLSRLMLKLGGRAEEVKLAGTDAAPTPARPAGSLPGPDFRKRIPLSEVPEFLTLNEPFDRGWRRVALALDRHGFTIEDRDRSAGLFYLRYADPEKAGQEEPNFIMKWFGAKSVAPNRYRVSVKTDAGKTTVRILDERGQPQSNDDAKRILGLLMEDLR
jgi:outer membrane protein assembly factor BamC